jgi:hypothetical protein
MAERERLEALRTCLQEYRRGLQQVNARLAGGAGPDTEALRGLQRTLDGKIEQTQIEIQFIENVDGLITEYTKRQQDTYAEAAAATDDAVRKRFEDYARFCEDVVDDALKAKQTVKPITEDSLNAILKDLGRAAQEAKKTVASINRAIEITNKALDALIILMKAAAKFAI